jgi:hypothetical protein
MKQYKLEFQGYTWDKFFHVIADNQGILAIYSGRLDGEGMVKMESLLSVSYEERFSDLFDSNRVEELRNIISPTQMLFYSYADVDKEVGKDISDYINSLFNKGKTNDEFEIHCSGACALFPETIIKKV